MEKYVSHLSLHELLSDYRRVVSSPCPHVYYFKRAQIWGWQTSIGLDDIANLYIHSLNVAMNEAAVWLAGFSQANRCLHLHVWKDLIWLGSDKMLGKLTRQPSKFEAFKRLLNITYLCIDSWFFPSRKELLISGTQFNDCKSTPSYSLYLRVLSTSTLTMSFKYSFPSSQGVPDPLNGAWAQGDPEQLIQLVQRFPRDMWSNQTYTHLLRSLGLSLFFVEDV